MSESPPPNTLVQMPREHRWCKLYECASDRLTSALSASGSLSPTSAARLVLSLLPARLATAVERRWMARGWMRDDAIVPLDALDDQRPGGRTRFLQLALFGPPGQGQPYREKHRMDVYQRLCAEIMTLGVDSASLDRVASRALNHPDVNADTYLASMVQSFVAERRVAVQSARISQPAGEAEVPVTPPPARAAARPRRFVDVPSIGDVPTRDEVLDTFSRLRREFESFVQQFEEPKAEHVLDKLRLIRQRFPVHVAPGELQACEEEFDRFRKRCGTYRRQIEELAQRGASAALAGDHETGAWVVRRLEAIHRLLPVLLPSAKVDGMRAEIMRRASEHEQYQTAQQIRQRKHEVIAQIRELAAAVHHFHQIAAHVLPPDPAYLRAERTYNDALTKIRELNTDWLSSLVLELEALLDELDDPGGALHSQLDQFISNVRTALNRLCLEIRARRQPATPIPPSDPFPDQSSVQPHSA